jgi:hypothetical protein
VDAAYENALAKIVPSLRQRQHKVNELSDRSKELVRDIDSFTTSNPTIGSRRESSTNDDVEETVLSLAIGAERLSYAQTVLEEKIHEVQDFERSLEGKIGSKSGTIVVGLATMAQNPSGGTGARRFLENAETFMKYLYYVRDACSRYLPS